MRKFLGQGPADPAADRQAGNARVAQAGSKHYQQPGKRVQPQARIPTSKARNGPGFDPILRPAPLPFLPGCVPPNGQPHGGCG